MMTTSGVISSTGHPTSRPAPARSLCRFHLSIESHLVKKPPRGTAFENHKPKESHDRSTYPHSQAIGPPPTDQSFDPRRQWLPHFSHQNRLAPHPFRCRRRHPHSRLVRPRQPAFVEKTG